MKWQRVTFLMMAWYIHSFAGANTTIPKPQVPFGDDSAGEILALDADIVPRAHFQVSLDNGVIPLTVNFDASLSRNGERYEWYFGDSTTGEGIHVEHTYTTAGEHPVILRVILDDEEEYVYSYINVYPDPKFTAPLPARDDSDRQASYLRRNTQYVINNAYGEGLQKLFDYVPANEIGGVYAHSLPDKNGIIYAYHPLRDGKPVQRVPIEFTAINLTTGERHSFSHEDILLRTAMTITDDARYVLMGVRGGSIYRIDTHTGESQLIFELNTENAVAYDVHALSINPDDSEVVFLLANTGSADLGNGWGDAKLSLPSWWGETNYIISIPLDTTYTTLSKNIVAEKGNDFFVDGFVWFGGKVYGLTAENILKQ